MKILGPAVALALVLCIGLGAVVPSLQMGKEPKVDPLTAQAAGDGSIYDGMERGALLDVPQGSISISASGVPDYRSIWEDGVKWIFRLRRITAQPSRTGVQWRFFGLRDPNQSSDNMHLTATVSHRICTCFPL